MLRLRAGERRAGSQITHGKALVVEAGAVLVARGSVDGRRIVLAVPGSGCVLAPVGGDEEVVALTDAVLAPANPSADQLLEALSDRERSLAILALPRHADRVRAKLLQLALGHGRVTPEGVAIRLPLTHELIADMTASARETVTWSLRELVAEGFVRREGRQYVVRVAPDSL